MSIDLKILTSRFADHREAFLVRVPMDEGGGESSSASQLQLGDALTYAPDHKFGTQTCPNAERRGKTASVRRPRLGPATGHRRPS
eukprot:218423-Prymnesium_polylepis.1